MIAIFRWVATITISVLLPLIGAAIGFVAPIFLAIELAGGGADWSGANQSAVGMIMLPIGGIFGIAGFALGAIYGYRILSSALSPLIRSRSVAEEC